MDLFPGHGRREGSTGRDDGNVLEALEEVTQLEKRLARARERLRSKPRLARAGHNVSIEWSANPAIPPSVSSHFLLLLSDSALPLGSFAFSSGLESYLAHSPSSYRSAPSSSSSFTSFATAFLPTSTSSVASTTLPFVLAAYRDPASLQYLDDALDAAIICSVGRRASVAQGRALLAIWEKSFAGSLAKQDLGTSFPGVGVLKEFSQLLKTGPSGTPSQRADRGSAHPPPASAHLAPLFGAIASLAGLTLHQTAYVFMLNHVKAIVSAAVRASVLGPYQAQKILASGEVQSLINAVIEREWDVPVENAGQTVPVMDLWIGRHEMLYSRIFNS